VKASINRNKLVLTDHQQAQANALLTQLCAARTSPAVYDKLRLGFRFVGSAVELFSRRPAFLAPHDWTDEPIAKFQYVASRGVWRLYCQRADFKWHRYTPLPESPVLDELVLEVDHDPTGIFWG